MATLRDLGLSEYESRAYRALLGSGATTAKELSERSDVPMGRIYDVLGSLEQQNLVRSQAAGRPKKYVAVEPDTALDRLLADRKRELSERADQYESTVDELLEELGDAEAVREPFWTVAVGPEETLDLLVERLAAADERILLATGRASPQLDLGEAGARVLDAMEEALDRGVEVSILLTPDHLDTLPQSLVERYQERLADRDAFAARVHEDIQGTFNLVDSEEVVIEVPNPLDPGAAFATIDFKDPAFAADVRAAFDDRWERADPLPL